MTEAETAVNDEQAQAPLFDLSGREFNMFWVDEKAPLFVANNPLHWKAHKLQIALTRLDKMAISNPAQFNSTVYMATLDKLADLMDQINKEGLNGQVLDAGSVAQVGDARATAKDSEVEPISMDS